jgi:PAS domain-containing protein
MIPPIPDWGNLPLHRLLRRQLNNSFPNGVSAQEALNALLRSINEAYHTADQERRLIENALEVNAQELTASNKKLRVFIDNAPVGIVMLDKELRYLFASHQWLEDRQLKIENIVGKSHFEVNPTLPERWKETHRRCLGMV